MFQPTQILRNEHEVILRGLHVLESLCDQIESGSVVSPEKMEVMIEFFRLYADRCHHGKEEDLLFPAMEAKGVQREGGPLGCMVHEHETNRMLVRRMSEAVAELRVGNSEAAREWAAAAREYAYGLDQHIYKENYILFVMAERIFTADEEPAMLWRFQAVDKDKIGLDEIKRLEKIVEDLAPTATASV